METIVHFLSPPSQEGDISLATTPNKLMEALVPLFGTGKPHPHVCAVLCGETESQYNNIYQVYFCVFVCVCLCMCVGVGVGGVCAQRFDLLVKELFSYRSDSNSLSCLISCF